MDGEDHIEKTIRQVGRLTDASVEADSPISLRSVHRAALASWAKKEGVPIRVEHLGSNSPFTIRALLGLDTGASSPPPASVTRPVSSPSFEAAGSFGGVGIDIEEVSSLPLADDYREHPFYQATFTPAEIAYCLRQANVEASFCGAWAAKEAVIKSGAAPAPKRELIEIEIQRDALGRPSYPGCAISISHTASTAVAVCIASAPAAAAAPIRPEPPTGMPKGPHSPAAPAKRRLFGVALGAVGGAVIGAALILFAFHTALGA